MSIVTPVLPEPVPLLGPIAPRKGALSGVAGNVLRDLPDVVDEREVEKEVPRILALVTTQRADEGGSLVCVRLCARLFTGDDVWPLVVLVEPLEGTQERFGVGAMDLTRMLRIAVHESNEKQKM